MARGAAGGDRAPGRPGVYLQGLADLRKVLAKINRDLARSLARSLREIGKGVKSNVQNEARRFRDSGTLERSIRYSVTSKAASVYTNVVYGPVHEWGGTIRPRGVPIHIPRRQFMHEGVEDSRRFIDGQLADLLDSIADEFDR